MSATSTRSESGRSLAKGPVALVGMLGIAFGVAGLIFGGHSFTTGNIPHGAVTGKLWLGVMANGCTNLLFIAGGLLLLLGSSMHWGAKTSAFIVAGVLGAAAVIAVIRGNGVFGIFAANHRTEIIWGGAAILLVLLSLLPRVGRRSQTVREPVAAADERTVREPVAAADDRTAREPVAAADERTAREPVAAADERTVREPTGVADERTVREPVARDADDDRVLDEPAAQDDLVTRREPAVRNEPVAGDERQGAVTDDERAARDEPVP